MMQMLEAGGLPPVTDGARPPDASNPRGYYEDDRVKRLRIDNSWAAEAEGHAVKVIAPLLPHLPDGADYRVLFMERDLDEVLRSQGRMLERLGRPAVSPDVLRGPFQQHVERAKAWVAARSGAAALDVPYAATVACPRKQAECVAEFLELRLDTAAMAGVVDASLYREGRG
ncbi:sulfotransferase family protein [Rubrivirga marina]|nr:sulfotransferase family protein [Rubrivirga marina]